MIRTTVRFDEELFKDARKRAIDERMPFASIVNEALSVYLGKPRQPKRKVTGTTFLGRLTTYGLRGAPKDLAKNHDKYTWE